MDKREVITKKQDTMAILVQIIILRYAMTNTVVDMAEVYKEAFETLKNCGDYISRKL